MILPDEIKQKSKLVIYLKQRIYATLLSAIGFEQNQIIRIPKLHWIYARTLYTCYDPVAHVRHFGTGIVRLSRQLRKHFKLDNIIPTQYFLPLFQFHVFSSI